MKLALTPLDPSWWVWFSTVALLALGLAGHDAAFLAAIALSIMQTAFYWHRHRSPRAIAVQIRLAYTLLLAVSYLPAMRWLYWLPAVGTTAMLVFGYCFLARCLSLLPWNRWEPLTFDLLRRSFFTAPRGGAARHSCGSDEGVCELEARIAEFTAASC